MVAALGAGIAGGIVLGLAGEPRAVLLPLIAARMLLRHAAACKVLPAPPPQLYACSNYGLLL